MQLTIEDIQPVDCLDLGRTLAMTKRPALARAFLDAVLADDPDNISALLGVSECLIEQKDILEARNVLNKVLMLQPNCAEAWLKLGCAAARAREYDAAENAFQVGMDLPSGIREHFLGNMGALSQYRANWQESFERFAEALRIQPTNPAWRMSLGMLYMAMGRYMEGMPLYESRLTLTNPFPFKTNVIPIWDGNGINLSGRKVMIVCEQGLGDVIMFSRYIEPLKSLFPTATFNLFCPDILVDLMKLWPFDAVTSKKQQVQPDADLQIAVASLPYLVQQYYPFREFAPLLPFSPAIRFQVPGPRRIGLCWRGNPAHPNDADRSITLNTIRQCCDSLSEYFSFQYDATEEELGSRLRVPDTTTWLDTMNSLKSMDLLISVDTAVAHLAATMGVKTWLLLPKCCDWRWGIGGRTSKWYPSVELFRQEKLGDWTSVLQEVRGRL